MEIKQMFISGANRSGKKLAGQKGVVIHWTANLSTGAGAVRHKNYVGRQGAILNGEMYELDVNGKANPLKPFVYGATQFYVDDKDIVQYIPTDEVAPHVGAKKYTPLAQKLFGNSPNSYLLGIEICVNPDSDFLVALENAAKLAAKLLKERKLTVENLYRHYDITEKHCPAMMLSESLWKAYRVNHIPYVAWQSFKDKVKAYMGDSKPVTASTPKPSNSVDTKVLSIQKKLNLLKITDMNGKTLAEDGIIGNLTRTAINKFKQIIGLKDDGVWDKDCDTGYAVITAKPLLKTGSKGIPVRYLQHKIGVVVDGDFGPNTATKTKTYQASKGLGADGIVGNLTWSMLFRY